MTRKLLGVRYNKEDNAYEVWYSDTGVKWYLASTNRCMKIDSYPQTSFIDRMILSDVDYLLQKGYRPHEQYGLLFNQEAFEKLLM